MIITCTRALEIDAGHRLQKHESKCRNVHGHRYKFEIEVSACELDTVGRVIDFGCIKEVIGTWLDENFDHAFIAEYNDPLIMWLAENKQKFFIFDSPPTAENLAKFVFNLCVQRLPETLTVESVTCWETPSCRATAYRM